MVGCFCSLVDYDLLDQDIIYLCLSTTVTDDYVRSNIFVIPPDKKESHHLAIRGNFTLSVSTVKL